MAEPTKPKRGRPRKTESIETTEKKPRGRPRKSAAPDVPAEAIEVTETKVSGRPRKDDASENVIQSAKRVKRMPMRTRFDPKNDPEHKPANPPKIDETIKELLNEGGDDEFSYKHLPLKLQVFIESYVTTLNGQRAAEIAGYSKAGARRQAVRLLENPEIKRIVDGLVARHLDRIKLTKDRVLSEIENMFLADANELVEYRRVCCRYCWGDGFRYQETPAELLERTKEHEKAVAKAELMEIDPPEWDDTRVLGYNGTKPPNEECPECWGQGVGKAFFKDTREISKMGKSIYAGVELTKNGIKINMHDKGKAAEMLAKHHKIYEDKVEVNLAAMDAATLEERFQSKMQEAHKRMAAVVEERGAQVDED